MSCNNRCQHSNSLALLLVTLCLSVLAPLAAQAAIHACKLADGSITYQDNACAVTPKPEKKKASRSAAIPFSIDKSWFEKPSVVPDRAVCTEAGCHCGMFSRKFKNGLPLAIADSLYLDGSWHRFDSTVLQLELPADNPFAKMDLKNERDEAACNILMSQKTLRLFGDDVLRELRNKKRYAEERGLDNPDDCDAGDMLACEYTDLIAIYDSIQTDIKSLRNVTRLQDESDVLETAVSNQP